MKKIKLIMILYYARDETYQTEFFFRVLVKRDISRAEINSSVNIYNVDLLLHARYTNSVQTVNICRMSSLTSRIIPTTS